MNAASLDLVRQSARNTTIPRNRCDAPCRMTLITRELATGRINFNNRANNWDNKFIERLSECMQFIKSDKRWWIK